jgi:two-component system response regulator MprA
VERGPVHVLVVDDDAAIREALSMALSYEGYAVLTAVDGRDALAVVDRCAAGNVQIDTMLIDLLMPELDGLALCRELRARGNATPILVLTALDAVGDRVAGLDAGADDYLPKPFDLAELLARVRALLRRVRTDGLAGLASVGDLRLDVGARRATRDGMVLALTATEFDLLRLLMSNVGRVLSREQIYEEIWGSEVPVTSRSLDVYVSYLRTKTESGGRSRLIETVRGQGFTIRTPS